MKYKLLSKNKIISKSIKSIIYSNFESLEVIFNHSRFEFYNIWFIPIYCNYDIKEKKFNEI